MLKNFLEVEGVHVLSKNELKKINGGALVDCVQTGNSTIIYSPDHTGLQAGDYVAVAESCEYSCKRKWLGITVDNDVRRWGAC